MATTKIVCALFCAACNLSLCAFAGDEQRPTASAENSHQAATAAAATAAAAEVAEAAKPASAENTPTNAAPQSQLAFSQPTFWILIARASGHLFVYNEAFELVFCVKKFNNLPEVVSHCPSETLNADDPFADQTLSQSDGATRPETVAVRDEDVIMELTLFGLGYNQRRPVLSMMIDDTIVLYELFAYDDMHKGRKKKESAQLEKRRQVLFQER